MTVTGWRSKSIFPTGAAGDSVIDAAVVAGVIVRPLIDEARSVFSDGVGRADVHAGAPPGAPSRVDGR